MKRGLVFSMCAAALALGSSFAHAQAPNVQLSLNLRYTDPADPSEGGTWYLVGKTNSTQGISAISAYLSNIASGTAGSAYGRGTGAGNAAYANATAATIGAILNGGNPFKATVSGTENIVYGQDTANGPIVINVGRGTGTPGNTATDPLRNVNWDNSAIIASGTFAGGGNAGNKFNRPAFVAAGANSTDANTLGGAATGTSALDANTTVVVRGDSAIGLALNDNAAAGIRLGDVDRNGLVNLNDFGGLSANFGNTPGKGWDQGDFNDDGLVNLNDFGALSAAFGQAAPPAPGVAAAAAIPEPTSVALLGIALLGLGARVKRS